MTPVLQILRAIGFRISENEILLLLTYITSKILNFVNVRLPPIEGTIVSRLKDIQQVSDVVL